MQSSILIRVLLLTILVVGCAHAQRGRPGKKCGPGEEFVQCGSACPPVCGQPPAQACTFQCVSGCFCRPGFIRAPNRGCIPQRQCPPRG
uniref:Putative tick til 6 n=1 Tax=Amblyomma triste TaxID=251400 RepID=A0A023G3Q2_AMBTT